MVRTRPDSKELFMPAAYYRKAMHNGRVDVGITGIGVVSPFGVGRDVFWRAVTEGRSGTRAIERFDASEFHCQVAAPVPDAEVATALEKLPQEGRSDYRRMARSSQIA